MEQKKIVALVGDFYHDAEPTTEALEDAGRITGRTLVAEQDPARFPWTRLADFAIVVIAREARVRPAESEDVWTTSEHEKALEEYVRGGGALMVLHAGLASYDPAGPYIGMTRGYFLMHPKEHPAFYVSPLTASHRIGGGVTPFVIQDEMYFVKVDAAHTEKLFESRHDDYGSSCAGWAHAYGDGRVFCFTPGHRAEVLAHPSYRTILAQGVRWLTDQH